MYLYFVTGKYGPAAVVATLLTVMTLFATAWLFRRMVRKT